MKRKATQFVVPVVSTEGLDVNSLASEHEIAMKGLNEHLGNGWRIFSTHTVTNNLTTYIVYVLTKLEYEERKEE